MKKSISLEFEVLHNYRWFLVGYEICGPSENLIMSIVHDDLPIDTVELKQHNSELHTCINNAMKNNSATYWATINEKELAEA